MPRSVRLALWCMAARYARISFCSPLAPAPTMCGTLDSQAVARSTNFVPKFYAPGVPYGHAT